ncbi:MAG: hypothetical protein P1U40_12605 [Coxiellaceae bacterium]|nr:hypothetical protein [Coxiellaceae bacterium]
MRALMSGMHCLSRKASMPWFKPKHKLLTGIIMAFLGLLSVIAGTSLFLTEISSDHPNSDHLWSSDELSIGGASVIFIAAILSHLGLSQLDLTCTNSVNTDDNATADKPPRFTSQQLRWMATTSVTMSAICYGVPYFLQDRDFIQEVDKKQGATIAPLTIASYPITMFFFATFIICFKQAHNNKVYEAEHNNPLLFADSGSDVDFQRLEDGSDTEVIHYESDSSIERTASVSVSSTVDDADLRFHLLPAEDQKSADGAGSDSESDGELFGDHSRP